MDLTLQSAIGAKQDLFGLADVERMTPTELFGLKLLLHHTSIIDYTNLSCCHHIVLFICQHLSNR